MRCMDRRTTKSRSIRRCELYTCQQKYLCIFPIQKNSFSFFFNDPPTTEIYPLPLHDALPISVPENLVPVPVAGVPFTATCTAVWSCTLPVTTSWLARVMKFGVGALIVMTGGVTSVAVKQIGRAHV